MFVVVFFFVSDIVAQKTTSFVERHHTDVKMLRKVYLYDEKKFVRSVESERMGSVRGLLMEREIYGLNSTQLRKKTLRQSILSVSMRNIANSAYYVRMIGNPTDVKFSPISAKKRWLVAGSSPSKPYELLLFDLDAREKKEEFNLTRMFGHKSGVITEIQWSKNGEFIATSGFDSFVRIWNPETGNQISAKKQMHAVHGVIASKKNSNIVASRAFENMGNSTELRVWNINSDSSVDLGENYSFLGHVEQANFFGEMEEKIVAVTDGSQNSAFGEAIVWDWENSNNFSKNLKNSNYSNPLLRLRPHDSGITCVDVAKEGNIFCTGGTDKKVAVIDARSGKKPVVLILNYSNAKYNSNRVELQGVLFSPSSTLIAAASNRNDVIIFDVRGAPIPLFQLNHKYPQSGFTELPAPEENELQGAYRMCWSPFGNELISGGEDGCIRIWNCSNSESELNIKTIRAHSQCVSALDVSSCGNAIASGADDLRVGLFTSPECTMQLGQKKRDGALPPI